MTVLIESGTATRKGNSIEVCADGCGRGCSLDEYEDAVENASRLQYNLGKDWDVRVWDNLGWHYQGISRNGVWKISVWGGHYSAYLGKAGCGGEFAGYHPTDVSLAMDDALALLNKKLERYDKIKHAALETSVFIQEEFIYE